MGGGGIGRSYSSYKKDLDTIAKNADTATFKAELARYLVDQLKSFNDRDADLVNTRLDELCDAIDAGDETIRMTLGGSVAKHTYVDGLSDIDVLMPVNSTDFEGDSPPAIKKAVSNHLSEVLGNEVEVATGTLAVTVQYRDGMQIQILPAIRTEHGLKIPGRTGERWSNIDPKGFTSALSAANSKLGMKLVPTIKVVKAINSTLPEKSQLSGYHVESLAIEVFRGYRGERSAAAMTRYFFEQAKDMVMSPIRDKTGQSLHVDGYLGPSGSRNRKIVRAVLDRIDRRLSFANTTNDLSRWQEFFE